MVFLLKMCMFLSHVGWYNHGPFAEINIFRAPWPERAGSEKTLRIVWTSAGSNSASLTLPDGADEAAASIALDAVRLSVRLRLTASLQGEAFWVRKEPCLHDP